MAGSGGACAAAAALVVRSGCKAGEGRGEFQAPGKAGASVLAPETSLAPLLCASAFAFALALVAVAEDGASGTGLLDPAEAAAAAGVSVEARAF